MDTTPIAQYKLADYKTKFNNIIREEGIDSAQSTYIAQAFKRHFCMTSDDLLKVAYMENTYVGVCREVKFAYVDGICTKRINTPITYYTIKRYTDELYGTVRSKTTIINNPVLEFYN